MYTEIYGLCSFFIRFQTAGLSLPLHSAREDFTLYDPLTGAPLSSPLVVLSTLKQRRLEEASRGAAHRSGLRAASQGVFCDGEAGRGRAPVEHKERGHGAQLDLAGGYGRRARRRDVFHPTGDAQDVPGFVCHALGAAPGAAEVDSDADWPQGREVHQVVYKSFCAGRDPSARRAVLSGSGRGRAAASGCRCFMGRTGE